MELANLEVAVIYKKNYDGIGYHVLTHRPSQKDADVWLWQYTNENEAEMKRNYKIEMMPLFEVLNSLLAETNELREKVEYIEENYNR